MNAISSNDAMLITMQDAPHPLETLSGDGFLSLSFSAGSFLAAAAWREQSELKAVVSAERDLVLCPMPYMQLDLFVS